MNSVNKELKQKALTEKDVIVGRLITHQSQVMERL